MGSTIFVSEVRTVASVDVRQELTLAGLVAVLTIAMGVVTQNTAIALLTSGMLVAGMAVNFVSGSALGLRRVGAIAGLHLLAVVVIAVTAF